MHAAETTAEIATALNETRPFVHEGLRVCLTENENSAVTVKMLKRGHQTYYRVFLKQALRRGEGLQISPSDYGGC